MSRAFGNAKDVNEFFNLSQIHTGKKEEEEEPPGAIVLKKNTSSFLKNKENRKTAIKIEIITESVVVD